MSTKISKEEYNSEPVHYCTHCLSLAIRISGDLDYCDNCGNCNIEEINIKDWEKLYKEKYGKEYISPRRQKN